ncbi:MAG: hypothetical protein M3032_13395 [Verrucomicrobiota bacterium]|nr:hypothetical protein [Verrucomicrobiota bacterium]
MRIPNELRAPEGIRNAAEGGTLSAKAGASRCAARLARALVVACALGAASLAGAIDVSHADAMRIGRKIWQNECAGTVSGLTSWNSGENFASLGIGHFIWYPKGVRGPFEESFPDLVRFAASRNAKLPQVVIANRDSGCPWSSRAEFLAATDSPPMTELRRFLAATVDLQAEFLVERLQHALPKLLAEASPAARANVERQFARVATSPQGCYALIDYVNFKGEGVLDTERYGGQGWGLLQVLEGMTGTGDGPPAAQEFARSARSVLTRRVKNSPPDRKESLWLAGWLQRVASYTH